MFVYLGGSLLMNEIGMKRRVRILGILLKLVVLCYVGVVKIIVICGFYVVVVGVVEWVWGWLVGGLFGG